MCQVALSFFHIGTWSSPRYLRLTTFVVYVVVGLLSPVTSLHGLVERSHLDVLLWVSVLKGNDLTFLLVFVDQV
jgi:hypothetical protein